MWLHWQLATQKFNRLKTYCFTFILTSKEMIDMGMELDNLHKKMNKLSSSPVNILCQIVRADVVGFSSVDPWS